MPRRSSKPRDPWRRENALRRADFIKARAEKTAFIRYLHRIGCSGFAVGVVREREIARVLGTLMERGEKSPELAELDTKLESFCRFARREQAFVREQLAAIQDDAPDRGGG